ncbi:hypothetical protein Tco_0277155 [Tanacetum coccineum]
MVAYLKKLEGSEEFHQIVDSLIKRFWETATARTLDNGEIELTATIDGKVKIVTEASIRRHLQLADSNGISCLPNIEIFEQLSLMGYVSTSDKLTFKKDTFPLNGDFSSIPSYIVSPTQSPVADEAASTGVDVRYGGAFTTVTGLEAGRGSGNIDKTPTMPYDSPLLRVNTLRSDEGSMTLQELMVLCTTLSKKVESLETDLQQTKLTYGVAYTKLIKKVKKLENKVKSSQAKRRARIIVSDDEDDLEDPSKQGRKIAEIDQDPAISLVQHDAEIQGRHEHDIEFDFDLDAAKDVSTAKPVSTAGAAVTITSVAAVSTASPTRRVSTADDITMTKTLVYIRKSAAKEKGKGKMDESELEDIQARVEPDEELAQRLQAEEREIYTEAEQARMLNMGGYTLQQLRGYSFDEIKNLFETIMRRVHTFVPIDSEIERVIPELAAGSSKRDAEEELDQESSKRQKTGESSEPAEEPKDKEDELRFTLKALGSTGRSLELEIILRLYDSCGVHHVSTEKGIDIYMLVEKEYPLSRGTLTQMLVSKLLVDQDNEMSRELLRKIFMHAERPRR